MTHGNASAPVLCRTSGGPRSLAAPWLRRRLGEAGTRDAGISLVMVTAKNNGGLQPDSGRLAATRGGGGGGLEADIRQQSWFRVRP